MSQSELHEHRGYLADERRTSAYRDALEEIVRPSDTVLDLGAGTGLLGYLACEAGAKEVIAVDRGDILELAHQVATDNGYADRITQVRSLSTELQLDVPVDVIVCDQIGGMVHDAGVLGCFADARRRLLAPGGRLVPSSFRIFLAPVTFDRGRESVEFWSSGPGSVDVGAARSLAANTEWKLQVAAEELTALASPQEMACFASDHEDPIGGKATFAARRPRPLRRVPRVVRRADVAVCDDDERSMVAESHRALVQLLPVDEAIAMRPGSTISRLDIRPRLGVVTWTDRGDERSQPADAPARVDVQRLDPLDGHDHRRSRARPPFPAATGWRCSRPFSPTSTATRLRATSWTRSRARSATASPPGLTRSDSCATSSCCSSRERHALLSSWPREACGVPARRTRVPPRRGSTSDQWRPWTRPTHRRSRRGSADGRVWRRLWQTPDGLVVHIVDHAVVAVSDAGLITFDRALPEEMEQHLLMDHILPLVLATSGALVVHGGVISLDGRGPCWLGSSELGKSTLTAYAWKQGWVVGGDDAAVVAPGPPPTAEPTYPTMRLTRDSAALLGIDVDTGSPVAGKIRLADDRVRPLCAAPVPVGVIAIVTPGDAGDAARFDPVAGAEAHAELFGSTFHADLRTRRLLPRIVDDIGQIIDSTLVGRLVVPWGWAGLHEAETRVACDAGTGDRPLATRAMRRLRFGRRPTRADAARFIGHLRTPQRASALRSVIDGVIVARTLRQRGARPLLARIGDGDAGDLDPVRSIEVAAAVDAGLGLIPIAPTCLRRSITLLRELKRLGLDGKMHVGVQRLSQGVEAHAWVQVGAVVVNDDRTVTDRYVELAAGEVEAMAAQLR